jgi:hypothetical protein
LTETADIGTCRYVPRGLSVGWAPTSISKCITLSFRDSAPAMSRRNSTGHNRCIIAIKPENVGEWLNPSGVSQSRLEAISSDLQCPYYEHRIAA